MGISYVNDVITVTGGSDSNPYTMADLVASGTTSSYVSTGGYGGRKYTVNKDLVVGSTLADTYFDITNSIIEMDAGSKLTVYTTALRGQSMGATFGNTAGDSGNVPFTAEAVMKARLENIRQLYIERAYYLDNTAGVWVRPTQVPRIVAVSANEEVTDVPDTA